MARPLRIEYEGAIYHIMSRDSARQAIFLGDHDREKHLAALEDTVAASRTSASDCRGWLTMWFSKQS